MFNIGDNIIYGTKGVYQVENIGAIEIADMTKDRIYYTLSPYYKKGGRIYTPADNVTVIMRSVISEEEAIMLIDDIKNIDIIGVTDDRKRELEYKEALKKCNCRELMKIIKTIYHRKQTRQKDGKRTTFIDTKYLQFAEENLYGELSVSLSMNIDYVKELIVHRINQSIQYYN